MVLHLTLRSLDHVTLQSSKTPNTKHFPLLFYLFTIGDICEAQMKIQDLMLTYFNFLIDIYHVFEHIMIH